MSNLAEEKMLVKTLSDAMLEKLRTNRDRGHWADSSGDYYLEQIRERVRRLVKAWDIRDKNSAQGIAADLANFAQMVVEDCET